MYFVLAVDQDRESLRGALSDLVRQSAISSASRSPEVSLREGRWVKLICGASFEVNLLSYRASHFAVVLVSEV